MGIDMIGLIAAFHLYALPPVVAAAMLGAWLRGRRADPSRKGVDEDEAGRLAPLDRERTVRRVGVVDPGRARGGSGAAGPTPPARASTRTRRCAWPGSIASGRSGGSGC